MICAAARRIRQRAVRELGSVAMKGGNVGFHPLSGLPSWPGIQRVTRRTVGSLALVTIDNWQTIGTSLGHAASDEAIASMGNVLRRRLPPEYLPFHDGGDAFFISSNEPSQATKARVMSIGEAGKPEVQISVQQDQYRITFSCGISEFSPDTPEEQTLREAETALWWAKHEGGARIELYNPAIDAFFAEKFALLDHLRAARREASRWREAAMVDQLTELGNRRSLEWGIASAQRRGPFVQAVVFIDIDQFHDYNHLHGDAAGDQCIRRVANRIGQLIRLEDTMMESSVAQAYRKGGEEFVVLAAVPDAETGRVLAERIRAGVEAMGIVHGAPGRPVVTVSVGVAMTNGTNIAEAIGVAAKRTFWLKEHGQRNQVRDSDEPR